MILSGPHIRQGVERGLIEIDPFEPDNINPASVDLRLGDEVAVYECWVDCEAWIDQVLLDIEPGVPFDGEDLFAIDYARLDIKKPASVRTFKIDKEVGWVLKPGILYLMHTLERVCTDLFVPVLDGKSSIGRLGITIHLTAGFGDPGYNGQYTLEVTVVHPVRVYPGMRFCQMRFHRLHGERLSYQETGQYVGASALGAVPSQAHKQFKKA